MTQERVYCVAASALPEPGPAVLPLTPAMYHRLGHEGEFRPRAQVEEDEGWRQIIPYAVIQRGGELLVVERLKAGSEARLHRRLSLGLGGHISPIDTEGAGDVIEVALNRELREELYIGAFFAEAVGLIHRADDPVSRVHTGVLYRVRSPGPVRVRETTKLAGGFASAEEIGNRFDQLEAWSQAALRFLKPWL